jgi:hypothetical protein
MKSGVTILNLKVEGEASTRSTLLLHFWKRSIPNHWQGNSRLHCFGTRYGLYLNITRRRVKQWTVNSETVNSEQWNSETVNSEQWNSEQWTVKQWTVKQWTVNSETVNSEQWTVNSEQWNSEQWTVNSEQWTLLCSFSRWTEAGNLHEAKRTIVTNRNHAAR